MKFLIKRGYFWKMRSLTEGTSSKRIIKQILNLYFNWLYEIQSNFDLHHRGVMFDSNIVSNIIIVGKNFQPNIFMHVVYFGGGRAVSNVSFCFWEIWNLGLKIYLRFIYSTETFKLFSLPFCYSINHNGQSVFCFAFFPNLKKKKFRGEREKGTSEKEV